MFVNLNAEMARKNISRKDIAHLIGKSYQTVSRKLNGETQFTLDEAYTIKEAFFSNMTVDDLFINQE